MTTAADHPFSIQLLELLGQGEVQQTLELCHALDALPWLAGAVGQRKPIVEHARSLLEALCPDVEAARREERLWACDCLEPRLPVLCAPRTLPGARKIVQLARELAQGLRAPGSLPRPPENIRGLAHIPAAHRAQMQRRMLSHADGLTLAWMLLGEEDFDGVELARAVRERMAFVTQEEARRERDAAVRASQAARYGSRGPHAARLRQAADRANEQAALADVWRASGRISAPRREAEHQQQARLLGERCRPYLLAMS